MKILLPCCGRSSRFPNQPPKWLLPAFDGKPMIQWAVSRLALGSAEIVVTILRQHEEAFHATGGLRSIFNEKVRVVVLEEPTASQSETVVKTLKVLKYDGPFLIKDSDNTFTLSEIEKPYNYVCTDSLNRHDEINARNKSYVVADHTGLINNIREKSVISDTFSVGGYYFTSAGQFTAAYESLSSRPRAETRELFVSDIIGHLISQSVPFYARSIVDYHDWGTIHEWRKFLQKNTCIFVALDGFVAERGFEFFSPRFENVPIKEAAVHALQRLAADGNSIIYLSIRPAYLSEVTRSQLAAAGLPEGQIVFGCANARWRFVTAPHSILPLSTFAGLEINPSDDNIYEKVISI